MHWIAIGSSNLPCFTVNTIGCRSPSIAIFLMWYKKETIMEVRAPFGVAYLTTSNYRHNVAVEYQGDEGDSEDLLYYAPAVTPIKALWVPLSSDPRAEREFNEWTNRNQYKANIALFMFEPVIGLEIVSGFPYYDGNAYSVVIISAEKIRDLLLLDILRRLSFQEKVISYYVYGIK